MQKNVAILIRVEVSDCKKVAFAKQKKPLSASRMQVFCQFNALSLLFVFPEMRNSCK